MKKIKKLKEFIEGKEEQDEVIDFDEILDCDGEWEKTRIDSDDYKKIIDISDKEDDFKLYLCWDSIESPTLFRKWKEGKK